MDLLFRLASFSLRLSFFEFDDVEAKLALNHVADLAGFQRISSLLEFRHHLAVSKPTEIAAFVLASIGRKLLRQFPKILTSASSLQNFFRLLTILLVGVEFRMTRKIGRQLLRQSLSSSPATYPTRTSAPPHARAARIICNLTCGFLSNP